MAAAWLPEALRGEVQATIDRLKLDDARCRRARASYYDLYVARHLSFSGLEMLSPFVAFEVMRQGLKHPE